jgi:hypothetical protein
VCCLQKRIAVIFIPLLLFVSYDKYATATSEDEDNQWAEVKLPWALGLVLPDGIPLEGGTTLDWSRVSNITAVIKLPNITWTDNTIYLILSAMNCDHEVIQVAAGLNAGEQTWLIYAFYIRNMAEYPQTYIWVANRSLPRMFSNDMIRLTLYRIYGEGWGYSALNLRTGDKSTGLFPARNVELRSGEQEFFAFESYTSNPRVFKEMGEALLEGAYIDGFRVEVEGYVLGGWDPLHEPLFIVGGGSPPGFIAVIRGLSQCKWIYSPVESWEPSATPIYVSLAYASTIVLAVVLATILIKRR